MPRYCSKIRLSGCFPQAVDGYGSKGDSWCKVFSLTKLYLVMFFLGSSLDVHKTLVSLKSIIYSRLQFASIIKSTGSATHGLAYASSLRVITEILSLPPFRLASSTIALVSFLLRYSFISFPLSISVRPSLHNKKILPVFK